VYVMAQTSPPKVWIMKRPSVQAGPPSWRTEVPAGSQRNHAVVAVWLPDGTRPPDVRQWAPEVRLAKETSKRNEYVSLPVHRETVGGHTIKHSINLTLHLSNSPPALPGGLHQTAVLAGTHWHAPAAPKGPAPRMRPLPHGQHPGGMRKAAFAPDA
jgi:hypothetical protein